MKRWKEFSDLFLKTQKLSLILAGNERSKQL